MKSIQRSHQFLICLVFLVIDEQEITMQIQMDARNVDRLAERSYCKDYARLGFGSLTAQTRSRTEPFRLTMVNCSYTVCQRYCSHSSRNFSAILLLSDVLFI